MGLMADAWGDVVKYLGRHSDALSKQPTAAASASEHARGFSGDTRKAFADNDRSPVSALSTAPTHHVVWHSCDSRDSL
jgi:hypothetical protein